MFANFVLIAVFPDLRGKFTDRWVDGHAQYEFAGTCCAICCLDIILEAVAVLGDPGDRMRESTPRAAATIREARTPTAAQ